MLSTEGTQRTDRKNRWLAGQLAAVAGFVNASGFLLIGTFTSHVTGNVGRLSHDVVLHDAHAAVLALLMVVAFFVGALLASMAIEAGLLGRRVYAALLLGEAALLLGFFVVTQLLPATSPRAHDAQALVLCAAMGLQNSLVTRLSGAVVRTTHLTGVVTDLGIEAARWFRYSRARVAQASRLRLTVSPSPVERPHAPKALLLLTILACFLLGGFAGAILTVRLGPDALVAPIVGLAVLGVWALVQRVVAADSRA